MAEQEMSRILRYTPLEKQAFMDFFHAAESAAKRKAGRPKKKKRGRPPQAIKPEATAAPAVTKKRYKSVLTRNELGALAMGRKMQRKRVNWDKPGPRQHRQRCANSWRTKSDLYREGESFTNFCYRVGIHWNTLRRFLKATKDKPAVTKKRGRKAFLSQETMEHICEGKIDCDCMHFHLYCFACVVFRFIIEQINNACSC